MQEGENNMKTETGEQKITLCFLAVYWGYAVIGRTYKKPKRTSQKKFFYVFVFDKFLFITIFFCGSEIFYKAMSGGKKISKTHFVTQEICNQFFKSWTMGCGACWII